MSKIPFETPNTVDVRALLENPDKAREILRNGLVLDLKCAMHTLGTVLNTPSILDLYVEEYWRRYVKFYEAQKAQPELDLNGNGHGG